MLRATTLQRLSRNSSIIFRKNYETLCSEYSSHEIRKNVEVSYTRKNLILVPKGLQLAQHFHTDISLNKYNKRSTNDEEESDDDPEFKDERDSKVLKTKVNSLRADLILRAGLGMARNKIEIIFYESKIRVNGKKLSKKSAQLDVGDEIDVIKGLSHINPTHLIVARVVVLSANESEDGYKVNLRRYKSLLVENYTGVNAFKSSDVSAQ